MRSGTIQNYASGIIAKLVQVWNAVGFTISGGTSSKTLTVTSNLTVPDITAAGQIIYGSAANVASALAAGLDGKVLLCKGAAAPEWSYNIQEITELCSVD